MMVQCEGAMREREKYGLRPRRMVKRLQQQVTRTPGGAKAKSRPAPLSKYRRKTANARERHRMKEINKAFDTLRQVLPEAVEVEAASTPSIMTKITTLRLAVDYIRTLSEVLSADPHPASPFLPHSASPFLPHSASPFLPQPTSPCLPSLNSPSDLDDLLSDDSCFLDDPLDAFYDLPPLPLQDPLHLLLEAEGKGMLLLT